MRATLSDGREVGIEFSYTHPRKPVDQWELAHWKPVHNGVTVCEITLGRTAMEKGTVVAEGRAACSLADKFVKEEGRLVALKRATEGLSKGDRRRVWEAFTNRRRPRQQAVGDQVV